MNDTGTVPRPTLPTVHSLFSPEWLRAAAEATAGRSPDDGTALRLGLRLTDPPPGVAGQVLVLVDQTTGALAFRAGEWDERPTLTLTLAHEDARLFLFGDAERRVRLFEHGRLVLEGVFLFVFFLDRLLQQDPSGALARLRRCTADAPPATRHRPDAAAAVTAPEDEAAAVRAAAEILPRTMDALHTELGRTTPGAQLHVSHAPSGTDVSAALGSSRPGVPFTRASRPIWYCCAKTLGAAAVGQLWERGLLDPMAPVARYLPWYDGDGRERVTLHQLLTHTSAVPMGLDPLHGAMAAPVALRRELLRRMTVPTGTPPAPASPTGRGGRGS
ncbi:serine hydrolase domain-containing protein [Streptomyces sp. CA-181903]|uniref:serine hydrolase domain-containing protein n=1 Tax=Streptomyces sp. CA-181903 TaxID=3240055 RepID=UPI003D9273F7